MCISRLYFVHEWHRTGNAFESSLPGGVTFPSSCSNSSLPEGKPFLFYRTNDLCESSNYCMLCGSLDISSDHCPWYSKTLWDKQVASRSCCLTGYFKCLGFSNHSSYNNVMQKASRCKDFCTPSALGYTYCSSNSGPGLSSVFCKHIPLVVTIHVIYSS